ncbi:hypothetical protein EDC96DRAFT_128957 [Choanephora cucurbitarum]|nr:hypothetical protein EDC96DRAFT_128957 [Choanephora cucurbitarum]
MGHNCSKIRINDTSSLSVVDHGFVSPQGIRAKSSPDYDVHIVQSLIRKGHLAPFYEGKQNMHHKYGFFSFFYCCLWVSFLGSMEPYVNKQNLVFNTECPICFLYYPSRMNRTRCCDKSICTECFLQLKRSTYSPLAPAVCPFCVQPDLGVLYVPPVWSKYHLDFKKRRSDLITENDLHDLNDRRTWCLAPTDPDVVLVDTIRPKWMKQLTEGRASFYSNRGTTRRRRLQLIQEDYSRPSLHYYSNDHNVYDVFTHPSL